MASPTRVVTRGSMTTAESQPTSADGVVGVPTGSFDWSLVEDRSHARWEFRYPSCPGARRAVDEFYADKPERPLVLNTGQAIVTRLR